MPSFFQVALKRFLRHFWGLWSPELANSGRFEVRLVQFRPAGLGGPQHPQVRTHAREHRPSSLMGGRKTASGGVSIGAPRCLCGGCVLWRGNALTREPGARDTTTAFWVRVEGKGQLDVLCNNRSFRFFPQMGSCQTVGSGGQIEEREEVPQ